MAASFNQPPNQPPTAKHEDAQKKTDAQQVSEDDWKAFTGASTELMFVLLPFIVIGIALAHMGEFPTLLFIPEWSIVSAVIVGQAIVKVANSSVGRVNVDREWIVFAISILLVCLLVPILIILAIALTSTKISITMAIVQAVLFILSCVVFWLASAIEHGIKPGA